ncbi:hypothetical protein Pan44_27540 [Caulifigura coniformis]|uniref:Right handed beta helix domain-containing protein n=1 Tax=Caulifigura coniformis TaxID=2527983 RepID=A0A517SF09_9PLAN|nr:right-handed parallel beta-helix repeat-containing protein [Caulifigura coniformis]QDT54719.1 hypothetical protein Pan44_27540 [Caulifigura coniformis]
MNWTRVSLFCLGAALLASSQSAFGQVVNEQTGVVQLEDYSGSMSLSNDGGSWMQVDRMSGDGVGFQSGYTRVGVRTKWLEFGQSHLFTELNGTMNDHGRLGTNLGLGVRTMYDGGVAGVHGWYDNYESNYGHNYQQATIGAEYLHQWLDLRANGYMPFGDRDNFIGVVDPGTELAFQGHDFGTIGRGQVERSLAGFDAEAGVPLPVATFLRLYGGTYFLTANDNDTWGVRSRLEARVGQSSTVNFQVTDDDRFGTNLNVGATIWYGGGATSPFKFQRDRSGAARRYDPVRRAQPVQLAQDREKVFVPLINVDTGNEFNITWVDNTKVAPGDGTFENPFTALPGSAPGSDYILVRRGVGNTVGNIVLENNQHLFGEGQVYTLNTDRRGVVEIPDQFFDQTGPRPTLVPTLANVPIVTLANNNEVINFDMTGGTASGIFGAFVQDFRIEHVQIDSDIGITITDASGRGILNNIDVPNIADLQTGIFIRNQGGDRLDLSMTDINTSGGAYGVQIDALGADVVGQINVLNTNDSDVAGLVLSQTNGMLNMTVLNADIDSNGDGIQIQATGDPGQSNIALANVDVDGAGTLINMQGSAGTLLTVRGYNVDASGSTGASGIAATIDDATGLFEFQNINASSNAVDGFHLDATNNSLVYAEITNSNLSLNGDNAFEVNASGGSVVQFFVDPTLATDSGSDAYQFLATDAGTKLTSIFIDVNLARAGQSAINGAVTNGAESQLYLANVQGSDSGLHGLSVNVSNGAVGDSSDFLAVISNSSFARSGQLNSGRGVNLLADNNSNIDITLTNTVANNNGSQGLHYEVLTGANGASSLVGRATNVNFSDNPDNNIFGQVTGAGSTASWTLTDVTADLIANSGSVRLASLAGGQQFVDWSGVSSSISEGNADGVSLSADGVNSAVGFAFRDGRINGNGGQGIDALATNNGQIQVDLEDAQTMENFEENVRAVAQSGGTAAVNALRVDLSQGGAGTNADNVFLGADGAGSIVGGILDTVNLDNSGLNGLQALITNDGSLDLQFLSSDPLNPSSASFNANGSGIRIDANNATSVRVVSSGESIISDNFADNVDIDVVDTDIAEIQIAGLMDRSTNGDGVNVNFDNVASGGISIGTGSAIDNFGDGVEIQVANSTLDQGVSVVGMTATGNGGEPIIVNTTASDITGGSISGNTTDGGTNGISWFSDSGTVDVNIVNNVVTNATNNGILVELSGSAVGNEVHLDDNTVNGDGLVPQNGIQLSLLDNASLINGTMNRNGVTGAADYGMLVDVQNTASVGTLNVETNIITGSGIDGFLYNGAAGTSLSNLVIADNASETNVGNGLNVQLDSLNTTVTQPNVEFRGNLSTGNGGNGILLTGVDTSFGNVDIVANETFANGGDGIGVSLTSPSNADTLVAVAAQSNTSTGNGGAGINIVLDGFDTTVVVPDVTLESNITLGNGAEGVALEIANMDAGALTVADSNFDNNGADGLRVSLTNNNTASLSVVRNTAIDNVLNGFNYDADNANLGSLDVSDNQGAVLPGASVLATISGVHWEITNTVADPLVLIDSVQYDVAPTGLTFATTRGAGFPFELYSNAADTGLQTINGTAVVAGIQQPGAVADGSTTLDLAFTDFDNGDLPLHFDMTVGDLAAAAVQNTADIAGTIFTATFSNGAVLSGSFDATGILNLAQAATGTGVSGNGLAGILIGMDNGSSIGSMTINGNDVIDNGTNGIEFNVAGGSTLPTAGNASISSNTITGHTNGDGVNIVNPDTGGADFGIDFDSNTITDNTGGSGVNIGLNGNSGVVTTTFTNNEISGNGNSGLNVNLVETANLQVTNFEGNTLVGNGQMGVRIQTAGSANMLLNGSAGNNTFDGNGSAGVGAVLSNASTADIRMSNSTITNTTAGALPDFNGQGVRVLVQDTAQLLGTSEFNNNTITGNASNGVDLLARDSGVIGGLTINDNTINGNGTNGIRIERQESGSIGQFGDRLEISGNTITDQTEGVFLIAANTDSTDYYEMNDNTITGMTGAGVHFEVRADADIDVNMDNNLISDNGTDGILTSEQINAPADSRSVSGNWTNNEITNNGRHGINLSASSGLLQIGTVGNGNLISGNANDGISAQGAGTVVISSNMITQNGSNGADDAGIDIQSPTFSFIVVQNNDIVNNRGDGIEFTGGIGPFGDTLIVDNNNISFNDGRGFDVLQLGNTTETNTDITFDNNIVANNLLEGVYVVFTADRNQSQSAASTVALSSNGSIDAQSQMRFNMNNNSVTANGLNSGFSSTGMVVRIGTMEAGANGDTTDDGGFISDGFGNFTNKSGVIMNVTNSNFSGNFGDDVYFESFVSTVVPPTSAGTWGATNDPTVVTTYRSDPLARLDLTFTGNTGDSADVTNLGAFYNNAEDVFKSRTNTQSPPNQGPFTSGTRRRNAQRLASRNPPFSAPAGGSFLYPGVGESTFRISAGSSTAGFASNPFPSSFGTSVGFGGAIFGELPFSWGSF